MSQWRIRTNDAPSGPKRGAAGRLAGTLLYPVFSVLLLIPWIRRQRRSSHWKVVRLSGWVFGAALLAFGILPRIGSPALAGLGLALVLTATLLAPLADPDLLRYTAEKLGALHTLNGGFYLEGALRVKQGSRLCLFLTSAEVLVVPSGKPSDVLSRFPLAELNSIQVAGKEYQPRYVSFAKEPPGRDDTADHKAICRLLLRFQSGNLHLEYQGVFSRHLAETTAHALHETRKLVRGGTLSLPVM